MRKAGGRKRHIYLSFVTADDRASQHRFAVAGDRTPYWVF
jgi:hypothetical protein